MHNIAILASGSGTNAENIVRTFNQGTLLRVVLVITDQPDAGVIQRMAALGVPTQYIPGPVWRKNPEEVVQCLRSHNVDFVVLAGFMRLIAPQIVEAYPNRILNIHPALLPAYGGKGMYGHHVHEAVIAAGETESGVTVHYVDTQYDHGNILMQERVEIIPEDTPATLEEKIHRVEYSLYPRAIAEALRRLDNMTPPPIPPAPNTPPDPNIGEPTEVAPEKCTPAQPPTPTPPAMSADQQWAEALHIPYTPQPEGLTPPPPIPPTQPAAAPQPTPDTAREPMPNNWFVLAIIATLVCCFVPGVIAIIYSSRVSNLYYQGDIEGARRASSRAELWIIISFCLGVLSATLYLPMMLLTNLL